jgi:hypothetical protein
MSKELTMQILDPVGVVEGEVKMKSSTINQIGRNRMVILDGDKLIGFLKIIDDGNGNIIDIELYKEIENA